MNNKVLCILAFSMGAAVGSVVSWKLLQTKYKEYYERLAQEEINSVKEAFAGITPRSKQEQSDEAAVVRSEKKRYSEIIRNMGYSNTEKGDADDMRDEDHITVIPPDEFYDWEDYDKITLTYYADGVLADDQDGIVENPDDVVGSDFASHFGDYEDDSIFIRNDKYGACYEILRSYENYSHPVEGE